MRHITKLSFTNYQLEKMKKGFGIRMLFGNEVLYIENTKYFNLITMKWE